MSHAYQLLHSASIVKEVIVGQFIDTNNVILLVKERSIEIYDQEAPSLVLIHEELFQNPIEQASKLAFEGRDYLILISGHIVQAYQFDESKFKLVSHVDLGKVSVGSLKVIGRKLYISDFARTIHETEFLSNFSPPIEHILEGQVIDFDCWNDSLYVLCHNNWENYYWSIIQGETITARPYNLSHEIFPYKLICSDSILIFNETSIFLMNYDLNTYAEIKGMLELYSSHCMVNGELYIAGDRGGVFILQNSAFQEALRAEQDPLIVEFEDNVVAFSKFGGYSIGGVQVERNWAIMDGVFCDWEADLCKGSLLVASSTGLSSRLQLIRSEIPTFTSTIVQKAGQNCLFVFPVDDYLFMSYPDSLVALFENKKIQLEALGLANEYSCLVGKSSRGLFQVTASSLRVQDGFVVSFEDFAVIACNWDNFVVIYNSKEQLVCFEDFQEKWKVSISDICCFYFTEQLYCGCHTGKIKVLSLEGSVLCEIKLPEEVIPNAMIHFKDFLVVGDREGRLFLIKNNETVYSWKIGDFPVTLGQQNEGLVIGSNECYYFHSDNFVTQKLDIDACKMVVPIDSSRFIVVSSDIAVKSLEKPYQYNLSIHTLNTDKGFIKRIVKIRDKIYYEVAGEIKIFDLNTREVVKSIENNTVNAILMQIPELEQLALCGESNDKGAINLYDLELNHIWHGIFPYRISCVCFFQGHLVISSEEHLFMLETDYTQVFYIRIRSTVEAMDKEGSVLYITNRFTGIIAYQYENKSLVYLWKTAGACESPCNSLINDKIISIGRTGKISIFEKNFQKLEAAVDLKEGGRCLIQGNFIRSLLPFGASKGFFVLTLAGSIYQFWTMENDELLHAQNEAFPELKTTHNGVVALDLVKGPYFSFFN